MAKPDIAKPPRRSARLAAAKSSTAAHTPSVAPRAADQGHSAKVSSGNRVVISIKKSAVTKSRVTKQRAVPRPNDSNSSAGSGTLDQSSARSPSTITSNTANRFLTLPGELRNKIYAMAIEDDLANAEDDNTRIQLLLTTPRFVNSCSQMRSEGISLFRPTRVIIYNRARKAYLHAGDSPGVYPKLHYRIKRKLETHSRYFAYQHETLQEACSEWRLVVEAWDFYTFVGAVEWDTQLSVKPMAFIAEGGGLLL